MIDDVAQSGFQFNLFRWIQVALENRKLQVVAKITTGFENLSQPLVIGNVVANKISRAHGSPRH
jgi:hypothetical protein